MMSNVSANGESSVVTDDCASSLGHHVKETSIGPYLTVSLNSQRPFDRPLRVAFDGATRINLFKGTERIVRRTVDADSQRVCDVFVVDSTMSSRHAFVALGDDGRYWVWDCGSRNKTYKNGVRVRGSAELEDGDWIGVGSTFILFRLDVKVTGAFGARDDAESEGGLTSLHPMQAESLGRAMSIAASPRVSALVTGPEGSGRRTVAKAIHERSGCTGDFVEVLGARLIDELPSLRNAREGTLYVRDVEGLSANAVGLIEGELASDSAVRLVGSSAKGVALLPAPVGRLFGAREIPLLPLSWRLEDLGQLVAELLERFGAAKTMTLRRSVSRALGAHPWTRNIAELSEVIESGVGFGSRKGVVRLAHLPPALQETETAAIEKRALLDVLIRHNGNVSSAAVELGISRPSVYKRAAKFGINIDALRKASNG